MLWIYDHYKYFNSGIIAIRQNLPSDDERVKLIMNVIDQMEQSH